MKTPAPKHRAIIHLAADMRKGAGAHHAARRPGPSADEWDDEDLKPTAEPDVRQPDGQAA